MGKRSTNTTKGGKFMNPTDQARKEARRKELKKNKKTRMAVRASVLKNKNVEQILNDLRDLDRQEYDPDPDNADKGLAMPGGGVGALGGGSGAAQDKVIKEKRRKLVETLDRVLKLYSRDDPDRATDVKSMINEYEHEKREMAQHFDAIRQTRFVNLDEIPLPPSMNFHDIPLPPTEDPISHSVPPLAGGVKQLTAQLSAVIASTGKVPPGPPPGKPPLKKFKQFYTSSLHSNDTEENSLMSSGTIGVPGNVGALNPVQARLMSLAGQPIPGQPMRPLSNRREEPLPPGVAPSQLPPPMMPPPQNIPLPPGTANPGTNRPGTGHPDGNVPAGSVFSAPPSIIEKTPAITIKHQPTIQAKPQINPALKAASTKFVPTALKVKREGTGHKVRSANEIAEAAMANSKTNSSQKDATGGNTATAAATTASKDEIYQQFLAEVSELL